MAQGYPADRMQLSALAPRQVGALQRFGAVELDPTIGHLVEMRASQINGCAFCLDMHWQDARAAGEEEARLYLLSAWRECPDYSERERAALALTEAMTRLADRPGSVTDDIWAEAAKHYTERQLSSLVLMVSITNFFNRINTTFRVPAGTRWD